jgi:hypothetical protein
LEQLRQEHLLQTQNATDTAEEDQGFNYDTEDIDSDHDAAHAAAYDFMEHQQAYTAFEDQHNSQKSKKLFNPYADN